MAHCIDVGIWRPNPRELCVLTDVAVAISVAIGIIMAVAMEKTNE